MNVDLSAQARLDLFEILEGLAAENTDAARALNAQFDMRFNQLGRLPRIGRPRKELGADLRGLLIDPYIAFYRIVGDRILVVRILHGRRDLRFFVIEDR